MLKKLQEIDLRLDELKVKKENLPEKERLNSLTIELEKVKEEIKVKEETLKETEHKEKKIDDELGLLSEKIKKEENRLYGGTITNPKELTGIQSEVNSLVKRKDAKETELLEILDVFDDLKKEIENLSKQLGRLNAEITEAEKHYQKAEVQMEEELKTLANSREEVILQISSREIELYNKLRAKKGGAVVVEMVDGICQGCGTELPSEEVDEMMRLCSPSSPNLSAVPDGRHGKTDKIWRCPNCRRIVYLCRREPYGSGCHGRQVVK